MVTYEDILESQKRHQKMLEVIDGLPPDERREAYRNLWFATLEADDEFEGLA